MISLLYFCKILNNCQFILCTQKKMNIIKEATLIFLHTITAKCFIRNILKEYFKIANHLTSLFELITTILKLISDDSKTNYLTNKRINILF